MAGRSCQVRSKGSCVMAGRRAGEENVDGWKSACYALSIHSPWFPQFPYLPL